MMNSDHVSHYPLENIDRTRSEYYALLHNFIDGFSDCRLIHIQGTQSVYCLNKSWDESG